MKITYRVSSANLQSHWMKHSFTLKIRTRGVNRYGNRNIEIEKNEWVSYRNRNYFFRFMSLYRTFLLKFIDIYINKKTTNLPH